MRNLHRFGLMSLSCVLAGFLASSTSSQAATVNFVSADGNSNPSAFNGLPAKWNPQLAPTNPNGLTNDYVVNLIYLRTPINLLDGTNLIFYGNSLRIDSAGGLGLKSSGGSTTVGYTVTVTNLILNGGVIDHIQQNLSQGTVTFVLDGNLQVNANSTIRSQPSNGGETRQIVIKSPITGSAGLTFTNYFGSGGYGKFYVYLAGSNPGFSGPVTIGCDAQALREMKLNLTNALALGTGNYIFASGSNVLENTSGSGITLTNTLTGAGGFTKAGADEFTLTGNNTYSGTTYVREGSLKAGSATALGAAAGSLGIDGTLELNGFNPTKNTLTGTGIVQNNGATDVTLTLNATVTNTFSGSLNDGSKKLGLVKLGAGTQVLNGGGSASGSIKVGAGTLALDSGFSISTSSITVSNGATLGFQFGSLSANPDVVLRDGGNLKSLQTTAGQTLTMNTLALGTSATGGNISLQFNNAGTLYDALNVTGAGGLTITGGKIFLYYENSTAGVINNGTYNIITYNTSFAGSTNNLSVGNPVAGLTYLFQDNGFGTITLTISGTPSANQWTDVDGNWSTPANWLTGVVPNGAGVSANFGALITTPRTVTLDAPETAGSLVFNNNNSYTLADAGFTLSLNNGGATNGLIQLVAGNHTVSPALSLANDTVVDVASGSTLTLNSAISGAGKTLILTNGGSVVLNGTNSSGPTVVHGGTLQIADQANLGPNPGSFNAAQLQLNGARLTTTADTALSDANRGITISNATLNVNSGTTLSVSDVIAGVGGLTKSGSGTLVLSGNNNYTGGTTLQAGTLTAGSTANLGASTNPITISGGATLQVTNSLNIAANSAVNVTANNTTVNISASESTLGLSAPVTVSGSAGIRFTGGGVINLTNFNSPNILTIAGDNLAADTNGTVLNVNLGSTANFTNNYSLTIGQTGIGNGTLNWLGGSGLVRAYRDSVNNLIIGGVGPSGTTTYGTLNVSQGTLTITAKDKFSIGAAGPGLINVSGGTLVLGAASDQNGTIYLGGDDTANAADNALGTLTVSGTGLVSIPASGSFVLGRNYATTPTTGATGIINLNGGTLETIRNISLGDASGVAIVNFNGGKLKALASSTTFMQGLTAVSNNATAIIDSDVNNITIGQGMVGAGGLTKLGSGTLTLSGTNEYAGLTTVSNGNLLVNGQTAAGAVTVISGAALGGTGTVGGNTTVNGTLAPGTTGIGTLTFAGNLSIPGSALFEINKTTLTNDFAAVTGTLTGGGTITVNNLSGSLTNGDTFVLFSKPVSGGLTATLPALGSGLAWTNKLAIDGSIAVIGGSSQPAATNITYTVSGNQLVLNWPAGQGWLLQAQTNSLNAGLSANWFTISGATPPFTNNINVANPTVFYRLMAP